MFAIILRDRRGPRHRGHESESQWMKEKARRGEQEQEGAAPKQAKTRNASSEAPRQEESRVTTALIMLYEKYTFG